MKSIKEIRAAIDSGLDRLQTNAEAATNRSVFRFLWTYVLGWFFIAAISVVLRSLSGLYTDVANWVGLTVPAGSGDWLTAILIAVVLVLPWFLGSIVQWMLRRIRPGRDLLPLREIEQRLRLELSPDDFRAFGVVLIDFPNSKIRVLGLIASEFREPGTGRELAGVYVPNTPDAIAGTMRIVALEDLVMTEWTFRDFVRFHISYGAAPPEAEYEETSPTELSS